MVVEEYNNQYLKGDLTMNTSMTGTLLKQFLFALEAVKTSSEPRRGIFLGEISTLLRRMKTPDEIEEALESIRGLDGDTSILICKSLLLEVTAMDLEYNNLRRVRSFLLCGAYQEPLPLGVVTKGSVPSTN